jgi:signal transduction histidine kinase
MAQQLIRAGSDFQRTIGNAASDRRLRDADRHTNDFLAELGHELRSPLAAICNALQVLALDGDDAALRVSVLGLMERQTQCMGRLIDGLMEVSRIEHGKIHLRQEPVDLAACVARAVETVRSSFDARGHQFEVTLPPGPVSVNADSGRLEQVLKNLLNNAAKYTEPGGRIWLTAEARASDVVLRVRDTGIGIDREMLPHVFESFWQVERTRDHSEGGLGIGLALVRKLVEMHGGSVSANSPGLGRGSEFVVRLPLASTPRVPDAGAKACDRPEKSSSRRIFRARESGFPVAVPGRKSFLGSRFFQTTTSSASDDPRCGLDSCLPGRDSRRPSHQKIGPRARSRVNDSGK